MQEVARREDEHEEDRCARDRLFFVRVGEPVQQKPRGERRERGDEERADEFVSQNECEGADEPGVERVEDYPARLDALGDVAHARDVQVVRRVPAVPNREPVVERSEPLVRRDHERLHAEQKDERLDSQHQPDEPRVEHRRKPRDAATRRLRRLMLFAMDASLLQPVSPKKCGATFRASAVGGRAGRSPRAPTGCSLRRA